jgi:DNA-binding winged helix-turn-helix (wHTH) protein
VTVLFGDWTFDPDARQLRRATEEVHLSTKAFDLLRLLLDARPRVLSKTKLQEALWPDVFVSEANLFTLISEIRTAIGDDARRARFVRTVHGVGYAFSGEALEQRDPQPRRSPRRTIFSVVCAGRLVPVGQGEHVLGRDSDLAVSIDSATVSRRHARIVITGDDAVLEDLGSKNGTYLNGRRLESAAPLQNGDRIQIGSVVCSFRASAPAATSTDTYEM